MGGVVGTGTGNDGNAACGALCHMGNYIQMLLVFQCGSFAGGAACNNRIGMLCNLIFNDAVDLSIINTAVGIHGGDHGNTGAGKNRCFHRERTPFNTPLRIIYR